MKQKVLFVATVDSHIELFHLPYLKMFKERGFEVHVATDTDKPIKYCDKKIKLPIKRSPFKLSNIKAIRQLKKIVNTEKYDIIHCHTPMGGVVARLAAKKARKNGTRVIYTAHGFHFYKGAPLKNWLFFYPVEKRLSKFTDTLITINTEDFERAKKKFGKRCFDIQYVPGVGVDEKKFEKKLSAKEKSELRKSLGLKDDDKVLIFPAELSKRKNQIWLIKTLKPLFKKDVKYHLILPGGDSLNGKCQKLVKKIGLEKQIHFLGFRDDVIELLQISDIAVSSARQEGLPVNLMEAAFLGLPIVATDCRGNRDVVNDESGILVLQGDSKKFQSQIAYIYRGGVLPIDKNGVDEISDFGLGNIMVEMSKIYNKKSPVLIIPSCDDLNRGDQALVFETKRLAEQIYPTSDFYVMSVGDTTQCESFGLKKMHDILEHPSRGKTNNNISYGMAVKIGWGVVALWDFMKSLLLLNKVTRPLAGHFYSRDIQHTINLYKSAENIFVKGGGFLHDYSGGLIGKYTIYYQLFHIKLALSMGKKVYIMPNSYGPFKSKHTSRAVRKILKKCALVTAREGISADKNSNGLGLNIDRYPDLAFFLEPRKDSEKVKRIFLENEINLKKDKIVAITARPYRFYAYDNPAEKYIEYKRTIKKFALYLDEKGYKVLFVVHTRSKNEHENDEKCIDEIMEQIGPNRNILKIKDDSMDCCDLKELYGHCDYVIGTRFHSVIFALGQKIPCIAITYGGNKGDGIMRDMNLDEYAIKIGDLNYDKIVDTFNMMVANKAKYINKIDKYINKAKADYGKLLSMLNGGSMRMAFFHDARLKFIDDKNVFTSGGLTSDFLKWYTGYFDRVTLVTRRENVKPEDVIALSSCNTENVCFDCVECKNPLNLLSKKTRKVIADNLSMADFAIIRLPSIIGLEACRQCEHKGKPYLVEMVGDPFDALWNHGGILYKASAVFMFFANRKAIRRAKNVIYVTEEYLQKRYKNYYNNVGISDVNLELGNDDVLAKRIKRIRDTYNAKKTIKLGLVGSLDVKFKGHREAIKSLSILIKNGIDAELHFLGNGKDENKRRLLKYASEMHVVNYVHFDGVRKGGSDVLSWMDNIDMYLIPSTQEGMPRALIEAMSRASVCVGTIVGGVPELLDNELLVKKKDVVALANVLMRLIENPDAMEKYAKKNFIKSKSYGREDLSKRRSLFYDEMLGVEGKR